MGRKKMLPDISLPPARLKSEAEADDPLMGLTPIPRGSGKGGGGSEWKAALMGYRDENPEFLGRCAAPGTLLPEDINVLMTSLEAAGSDGTTLDIFAAALRLTEPEFGEMVKLYPDTLGRSLQLSRANRKEYIMEGSKSLLFRSSAMFKEMMGSPAMKDMFELSDEKADDMSPEERIEVLLRERGVEPCGYVQGVFLTGDSGEMDGISDISEDFSKWGVASAEDLLDVFEKLNKKVDISHKTQGKLDHGHQIDVGGREGESQTTSLVRLPEIRL